MSTVIFANMAKQNQVQWSSSSNERLTPRSGVTPWTGTCDWFVVGRDSSVNLSSCIQFHDLFYEHDYLALRKVVYPFQVTQSQMLTKVKCT